MYQRIGNPSGAPEWRCRPTGTEQIPPAGTCTFRRIPARPAVPGQDGYIVTGCNSQPICIESCAVQRLVAANNCAPQDVIGAAPFVQCRDPATINGPPISAQDLANRFTPPQ
jgi:hypothetical protein